MTTIRQDDFIESVADALQFISYYHPQDYIEALGEAYAGRGVARREGRDRADPHQFADVRRGPPPDLPGHRHRRRVRRSRHGRALGRRDDVRRRHGQRGRAPRLLSTRTTRCARRSLADPAGTRTNTKDNTPAVVALRPRARRHGRGERSRPRAAAPRTSRSSRCCNPSDSIVDWVLKTVPTMGAGWCPPGMLGIGIGGTRREGDAAGEGSADGARSTCTSCSARGPADRDRGAAPRALRQGQRARHRRAGPGRAVDRARRQDPRLSDARGVEAGRDDPELRGDAPRALHARRHRRREARAARSRTLARRAAGRRRRGEARRSRHADAARRSRRGSRARRCCSQRQDAHRPRRRAQAHRRHARAAARRCRSTSPTASSTTSARSTRCATRSSAPPARRRRRGWTSSPR